MPRLQDFDAEAIRALHRRYFGGPMKTIKLRCYAKQRNATIDDDDGCVRTIDTVHFEPVIDPPLRRGGTHLEVRCDVVDGKSSADGYELGKVYELAAT